VTGSTHVKALIKALSHNNHQPADHLIGDPAPIMAYKIELYADSILHVHVMLSGERSSQVKHPIRLNRISRQWLWYVRHRGILHFVQENTLFDTRFILVNRVSGLKADTEFTRIYSVSFQPTAGSGGIEMIGHHNSPEYWLCLALSILRQQLSRAELRSGKQTTRRCIAERRTQFASEASHQA
jgi:hypothetical protein